MLFTLSFSYHRVPFFCSLLVFFRSAPSHPPPSNAARWLRAPLFLLPLSHRPLFRSTQTCSRRSHKRSLTIDPPPHLGHANESCSPATKTNKSKTLFVALASPSFFRARARPYNPSPTPNRSVSSSMVEAAPHPPAAAGPSALCCEHLTFSYPLATEPTVRDLSLDLPAGSRCLLIGANGAGECGQAQRHQYATSRSPLVAA
jgi:ABC-type multidrug transport system fused ATPase/permease subunit